MPQSHQLFTAKPADKSKETKSEAPIKYAKITAFLDWDGTLTNIKGSSTVLSCYYDSLQIQSEEG